MAKSTTYRTASPKQAGMPSKVMSGRKTSGPSITMHRNGKGNK